MWIPGHCDIHENEEPKRQAKNTATSTEISNYNQVYFSDIKKTTVISSFNTWQNFWSKQTTKLN